MTDEAKSGDTKSQGWWQTLPGILTATAAIITALGGLIAALHQAEVFGGKEAGKPAPPAYSDTANSPVPAEAGPNRPSNSSDDRQENHSPNPTDAASTDIDKPTWLTANGASGEGVGEGISYYYTFNAGPGEVKVILDGKNKPSGYSDGVGVRLLDMDAKELLSLETGNTTRDKRVIERLKIPRRQQIIMRVNVSEDAIDYRVRVEGAVDFKPNSEISNSK